MFAPVHRIKASSTKSIRKLAVKSRSFRPGLRGLAPLPFAGRADGVPAEEHGEPPAE